MRNKRAAWRSACLFAGVASVAALLVFGRAIDALAADRIIWAIDYTQARIAMGITWGARPVLISLNEINCRMQRKAMVARRHPEKGAALA